ncbi:MAG TPA: penicillin-binding protein [Chitinophagaceae bacterium]|nr:penicillin-binding protein [Chitinophagaceae bacterium]
MEVKRDILWRVYLGFLGMVVLTLLVLGKTFYIQRFQGEHWRAVNDSMHHHMQELDAERGMIYSEDNQMISVSIPQFDIYMDFQADGLREKNGKIFKENIDSFCYYLANHFHDKSAAQYKKELMTGYNKKSRYYSLRKKVSLADRNAFKRFPLAKLPSNKSGVIIEVKSKRVAPFGLLANRTIGLSREYLATNGKVKKQNVGLEMSYDSVLTGKKGKRMIRYVAGVAVPVEGYDIEPENGRDIHTTIDVNIQDISQNALLKMMQQSEALYGTCIVMEVNTGKIKAIANLGRQQNGEYWEDDNYALRVTEPGSTIKLVTLLAVLDKGSSSLDDLVEVGGAGRMQVGPRMVNDAERQPKSIQTVKECFAHSSNVGMSKLALKAFANNPKEFGEYLSKFHMDVPSPVDLSHLPSPRLAPLDKGNGGLMNMLTMSFGYAIQVSPLHTLTLYNAIANEGKMMKPYLVNSIQDDGVITKQFSPEVLEDRICSPEIVKAARESMEAVITEGTGKLYLKGIPFPVAGKTGTAHVADGNVKYGHGVYQASFVGYFPADAPKYSCIVVIRTKPHAAMHYGGQLAGPVFKEIAMKLYSKYVEQKSPSLYAAKKDSSTYFYAGNTRDITNIFRALDMQYVDSVKQNEWASVYAVNYQPVVRTNMVKDKMMPNVKGMGLKDALFLLESLGLKVTINGRGKVNSQSIAPGTQLNKGMTVALDLG